MYFQRFITEKLKGYLDSYKAIAVIGPRQSGKTTLVKHAFPEFEYRSLENPDTRLRAIEDPRLFLSSFSSDVVLDEIQNTPELFSYLQEIIDERSDTRKFILTGSNSFQISEKISQSLAGRVKILKVFPLLYEELPQQIKDSYFLIDDLDKVMLNGLYPAIYERSISPSDWHADYYSTYVQKDVRSTLNIQDLGQFDRFVRVCASRVGQIAQYSEIATDVGISQPTAVKWASVLEASFILFKLQPHYKNFGKRIIKSPKLYFYDTGLLCFLLRIKSPDQLLNHPLRGSIFENWVVSELHKYYYTLAQEPPLYFWRDQHGHEIDLIKDMGDVLFPIEIKSGTTFHRDWLKNIQWFNKLQNFSKSYVVYGGKESFPHAEAEIVSWSDMQINDVDNIRNFAKQTNQ